MSESESGSESEENRQVRLSEQDAEQSVQLYDIIREHNEWNRQCCAEIQHPRSPSSANLAYEAELLSRTSEVNESSELPASSSSSESSKSSLSLAWCIGSLLIVIVLYLESKLVQLF